ncbi:MAG: OmpH family outer membrane protein [bacterium]
MKRTVTSIWAVCLSLLLLPALARAEFKVGVVDLQKAMEISTEGKKAKGVFQKKVEKIQGDLKSKQDELNTLKEEFERQSGVLSEVARQDKEKSYQYKLRDYQRMVKDSQEELQREDRELSEKILKDLQSIIENYGKKEGFDLILEKTQSAVLYGSNKIDITDPIIKLYDDNKKTP